MTSHDDTDSLANTPFLSRAHWHHRLREGLLILTFALSVFVFIALLTYHRSDPSWSHLASTQQVHNAGGVVGAWVSDFLLYMFGYLAYLFPVMLTFSAGVFYWHRHQHVEDIMVRITIISLRSMGFLFVLAASSALASAHLAKSATHLPFSSGGVLGDVVNSGLVGVFNYAGSTLLLITILLIGITLFTGLSWFRLMELTGAGALWLVDAVMELFRGRQWGSPLHWFENVDLSRLMPFKRGASEETSIDEFEPVELQPEVSSPTPKKRKKKHSQDADDMAMSMPAKPPRFAKSKVMPKLSLLNPAQQHKEKTTNTAFLEKCSRDLESCLADYGVEAKVVSVFPGPVVTRYELDLAAGTKVSKISSLAKDLARSLSVTSVRIVEVIPGKSVIGLELPNEDRETVWLQEVLASKQYQNTHSILTLALGKDIAGHAVIVDLAKMPHLLVAGTTGSGKSVCLNVMLLSLLYRCSPEQLRLILIDPKMLELAVYDGIPHLLSPVVTDMKDAARALRWCVVEMERRYRLMASLGVRNIAGYNVKVREAAKKGEPLLDPLCGPDENGEQPELQELPYIVVLADEFADMMVVVGKKVEMLIARLAQKARAAGIHLIFATQRPSVDVITGLIKANIPTRIAFQVSQKVDSRTILDQQGAEQLLGHGDMLYLAPGTGVPVRVHGAFVSDEEVHRVVKYLKQQGKPQYIDDVLTDASGTDLSGYTEAVIDEGSDDPEKDPLYDQAVDFIARARRVSISSIQRRFKIGYNRAARIVEGMEAAGVVSAGENGGNRDVLVPPPADGE